MRAFIVRPVENEKDIGTRACIHCTACRKIYACCACAHLKDLPFYLFASGRNDGIYRWGRGRGRIHILPIKISDARRIIWTSVFSRFLITVNLAGPLMLLAFNARAICVRCEFAKTADFFLPCLYGLSLKSFHLSPESAINFMKKIIEFAV